LRPVCPSWMPATAPLARKFLAMRASGSDVVRRTAKDS